VQAVDVAGSVGPVLVLSSLLEAKPAMLCCVAVLNAVVATQLTLSHMYRYVNIRLIQDSGNVELNFCFQVTIQFERYVSVLTPCIAFSY
jgi:hypothetical protein